MVIIPEMLVFEVFSIIIFKVPDDQYSIELRIAVLGSSDVGKSTLLGVLTRGELDNGRGCARLNVFRHRHEVYSGKTSSISIQTMGFDSNVRCKCCLTHFYFDMIFSYDTCDLMLFLYHSLFLHQICYLL